MPDESEIEYLAARAEAERILGEEAKDPDAARIHAELARLYTEVVDDWIRSRPAVRTAAVE